MIFCGCNSCTAARYSKPFVGTDVCESAHPGQLTPGLLELGMPARWRDGQAAPVVGSVKVCVLSHRPQPVGPHQGLHAMSARGHTVLFHRSTQPAATIGEVASSKSGSQVNAGRKSHGRAVTVHAPSGIARRACPKNPACLAHGHGLLLQLLHQRVAHLSSRAEKADAFSAGAHRRPARSRPARTGVCPVCGSSPRHRLQETGQKSNAAGNLQPPLCCADWLLTATCPSSAFTALELPL